MTKYGREEMPQEVQKDNHSPWLRKKESAQYHFDGMSHRAWFCRRSRFALGHDQTGEYGARNMGIIEY